ncbi:MAG TPA: cupin domain-containing protein [Streptosporangiaceae bacterium]|jgi:quercetin dioxygenase-like cupin family protein|nr:cupin domain-containing protein [Streptosporangiaceae bacterium]
MDKLDTVADANENPVPDELRNLFNNADGVRVQKLPCELPELGSMAVNFGPGTRTRPHRHHRGQQLIVTEGVGVVGDEQGVHVVRAGDVISNPPGTWHWHGATPRMAMTHVTVETPGDFDLNVEGWNWAEVYSPELGA